MRRTAPGRPTASATCAGQVVQERRARGPRRRRTCGRRGSSPAPRRARRPATRPRGRRRRAQVSEHRGAVSRDQPGLRRVRRSAPPPGWSRGPGRRPRPRRASTSTSRRSGDRGRRGVDPGDRAVEGQPQHPARRRPGAGLVDHPEGEQQHHVERDHDRQLPLGQPVDQRQHQRDERVGDVLEGERRAAQPDQAEQAEEPEADAGGEVRRCRSRSSAANSPMLSAVNTSVISGAATRRR